MPFYELVYITRQDLPANDVDNLTVKFSKILEQGKGKVVSKEYWGLRELAYKINKNSKGHYVLLNIDAPYPAVAELERVMGFEENVIRKGIFKIKEISKEPSKLFVSVNAKEKR
ncbi:MAG: 30S ribosomal protein S6 [Rickettsiales bacterium]|jgi:small subunit ribosomal protein S6|nr:30S ribosomal protein S6 [Rickettsiales bacterium]